MNGKLGLDALKKLIGSGEIDTVIVAIVDMQGRLVGKRMTGHFFLDTALEESHSCNYLLTVDMEMEPVPGFKAASWDKGYGDFVVVPDMDTMRRIPWLPGTALVLGDVCDHEHALLPHAPRSILKNVCARLARAGFVAKMASELEFYVFDESFDSARQKDYRDLKHAGWYIEDYHIFQTSKEEELIRAIRNGMDAAGIPVENSKGEWGPGQEEINLYYAEAVEMADRHVIYKNGAKEIAWQHGKAITFMAKFSHGLAGSSFHQHSSLWSARGDEPLFHDPKDPDGISKLFRHYLAGLLALAPDLTLFLAPYVNSYKRFEAGSFAPTKIAWSEDNRTSGFRLLGEGGGRRVECRIPGADANPYMVYAALLAAGLHGIENELELPPKFDGNAYASGAVSDIPRTLGDAIACLERSQPMRDLLGAEVIEHYLHAARWELEDFGRQVTDYEVRRGFERC